MKAGNVVSTALRYGVYCLIGGGVVGSPSLRQALVDRLKQPAACPPTLPAPALSLDFDSSSLERLTAHILASGAVLRIGKAGSLQDRERIAVDALRAIEALFGGHEEISG